MASVNVNAYRPAVSVIGAGVFKRGEFGVVFVSRSLRPNYDMSLICFSFFFMIPFARLVAKPKILDDRGV